MAEIYTFSEQGMRELVAAFRQQKNEMSNLRRHMQHFQGHRVTYMPSAPVPFHNDSGEIIPAYAVMRVTSFDDDLHEVNKPNSDFRSRYLVNKGSEIPIDGTGRGTWLSDSAEVLYNNSSGTPAIDEEWGAKNGQWSLEKNRPGFLITGGSTSDNDVYKTRAKQHVVTDLIGKPDSSITKGSTGTVSIWMGASGSEAVTEYDITCRALGAAVTSAKYVVVFLRNGVWYVGPWECS